jgi:hypothetical protein
VDPTASAGGTGPASGYVYDGWRSGKNTRHFQGTVQPV